MKEVKRKHSYRRRKNRATRKKHRGGNAEKSIDLVVSRYKETLSWLDGCKERGFRKIRIYNKSDTPISCPAITNKGTSCEVTPIDNVGMCDHTYLYHIVHHYDSLADVTVFMPGSADNDYKKQLMDFTINKVFETKNTVMNVFNFDVPVGDAMYYFTMEKYSLGSKDNHNAGTNGKDKQALASVRPFGQWYAKHFPGAQTKSGSFFGLMAISREHLHRRPKSFYEGLLSEVDKDKSPEVSHFLERSWSSMGDPLPPETLYTHKVFEERIGGVHKAYIDLRKGTKFCVMAIFKNEAMAIREWVDHYKWQGADAILLLDNGSTDGGGDLVKDVPGVSILQAPKPNAQKENYNTIGRPWLKENGVDILAILDLDEFMFDTGGDTLKQRIVQVFNQSPRPSQFSCNWTMFGSSGQEKQPNSIRKTFTQKKKDLGSDIKSIMWLADVEEGGFDLHRSKVKGETITCPAGIQLNHYAIQSREFFEKVKMTRGAADDASMNKVRDWAYFDRYDFKDAVNTGLRDKVLKHEQ